MRFYGLRVYDMEESIVASGLPMLKKKYTPEEFELEVYNLEKHLETDKKILLNLAKTLTNKELNELIKNNKDKLGFYTAVKHIKRAMNLGNAKPNSGHDCALKGIAIHVNIEANQSFWLQWERYHHQDTVSSMSTMHCLCKFENVEAMFNKHTDPRSIEILNDNINKYNAVPTPENFERVINSCPQGIELCRRVVTNYLQIKTMLNQREHHKMSAWREDFVNMTHELPLFYELCGNVK